MTKRMDGVRSDFPSIADGVKKPETPGDHLNQQVCSQIYLPPIVLQRSLPPMASFSSLSADDLAVDTIHTLAADVVGKAKSGRPVSKHRQSPCLTPWLRFLSPQSRSYFLMRLFSTSGSIQIDVPVVDQNTTPKCDLSVAVNTTCSIGYIVHDDS